jgi:hypothetical protein
MGDVRNNLAFKKSVQVLLLAQSEKSQRTIAYRFVSKQSIVSKVLRRRQETGRHTRRPGQGRKTNHNTSLGPILKMNNKH